MPPLEDVEAILSHLPKDMEIYTISGGEPTESEDLLYGTLEYIQNNRKKQMPNLKKIKMFTNGLWLTDENRAYDLIGVLEYYGVNRIEVSFDNHHAKAAEKMLRGTYPLSEAFLMDMATNIEQIYQKSIELCHLGNSGSLDNYKPVPFGRAANLPISELGFDSKCNIPSEELKRIAISPSGDVYLCCFELPYTILGSAITEPMDGLINRAKQSQILNALITGGPHKVADIARIETRDYERLYQEDDCMACVKIFSELFESRRKQKP